MDNKITIFLPFFSKWFCISVITFFYSINSFSQSLGLNNSMPDASSILDITATDRGVLFPRMTTIQRNAIASPAHSLIIFNSNTNCLQIYTVSPPSWENIHCVTCNAPAANTAIAATSIASTSVTANWNSVAGATTYYLDVATDAAFTTYVAGYNNLNVGSVLTYGVSGLIAGTTYYYRVRASNTCGTAASSNTITLTTCNQGTVALLTSIPWSTATGTANPNLAYTLMVPEGCNRLLVVLVAMEQNPGRTLTSVSYGSQAMTYVQRSTANGATYDNTVEMWYLDEIDIVAAGSTTFTFTWSGTIGSGMYTAAVLANVDQTTPIGNTSTANSLSANNLNTGNIAVNIGDMVITGATGSNGGGNPTFSVGTAGYTEAVDVGGGGTGAGLQGCYRAIIAGATENPNLIMSVTDRMAVLGAQINHD